MRYFKKLYCGEIEYFVKVEDTNRIYITNKLNIFSGVILCNFLWFPIGSDYVEKTSFEISFDELPEDFKEYINSEFFEIDYRKILLKDW